MRIPADRVLVVEAYDPAREKYLVRYYGSLGPYKTKKHWVQKGYLPKFYILKSNTLNGGIKEEKQTVLFGQSSSPEQRIAVALERIADALEKGLQLR